MSAIMEVESTLTDRYQTTVPETVRRVLRLGKRDSIHYLIQPDGTVLMTRASQDKGDADPVLSEFLNFLAKDMAEHPERLETLDANLLNRIRTLTANVPIDLNAALDEADE